MDKESPGGGLFSSRDLLPAFAVLMIAAGIYGIYGFDGPLYRDYGIYLYGGQLMADGVPPYAGIFDHKGPLPVALAGFGVVLSGLLGTDDIYTVRAVFFLFGCLSAVSVYVLGRVAFDSRTVGLLAALTFVGFQGYCVSVGSGPEPKTALVMFEALCLASLIQRRWFLAGLLGSLAALTWQPAGLLLVVGGFMVLLKVREEKLAGLVRFSAGTAIPLVATLSYYVYNGAVRQLFEGLFVFNLLRVSRSGDSPFGNPVRLLQPITSGYDFMVYPAAVGLAVIIALVFVPGLRGRVLPILICLPLFVAWSLTDFQVPEDFYVFLPFASVGFGAVLWYIARSAGERWNISRAAIPAAMGGILFGAAIVGGPLVDPDATPGPTLPEQEQSAVMISEELGRDADIVSINAPQVLALLHDTNPNQYLFITDGIDRQIDATYPGGFGGWVEDIQAENPDGIAFFADAQRQMPGTDLTRENRTILNSWLDSEGYQERKIGNFWLYVRA